MLRTLVAVALLLSAADHLTTYLCLAQPAPGWEVVEANPFAAWLFARVGVGVGLILDSLLTLLALVFLLRTRRMPEPIKLVFASLVVLATGLAVANNLEAMSMLGFPPFGSI